VLSTDELRRNIVAGSEDAAQKGKVDGLTQDEINHLTDIFRKPSKRYASTILFIHCCL
jgi:hypothetical protein